MTHDPVTTSNLATDDDARSQMSAELANAAACDQLRLHYQPQLRAGDGRVLGFEALARWRSPVFGEVAPETFIALAEETGLIHEIGRWIFSRALSDFAPLQFGGDFKLAVNISRLQLKQPDFLSYLAAELARTQVSPDCLELEITESIGLTEDDAVTRSIAGIRDLGIALALDDFGTGYSNLATLGAYRFNSLKLDRGLVHGLLASPRGRRVMSATITFGKSLDLQIIAEGVETQDHADFMRQMGCDQLQGFLYAPALPLPELQSWLSTRAPARI
jgi:EAL domain-containing protein (putative c-di-GMP-specific phosphodiesterase class I)